MRPAPSARLSQLPTYVFAELDELKAQARARGADLIDLGMGNPDVPIPQPILERVAKAVMQKENFGYPHFKGKPAFRRAAADWMKRRYHVNVDPETEIQALIGSKEGLAHLSFAYIGDGDVSIVPNPYYPVHSRSSWLAGGDVHHLPLTEENDFLPRFDQIPADICKRAKLFFVSYPNNPTTAIASEAFYKELIDFCTEHQILLVSDLAYGEICFEGYRPPSVLSLPGAKEIAVEFHSFSKTFSMAGHRIGFACGNAQAIRNLYDVKTNLDYGVTNPIQEGAIEAMDHGEEFLPGIIEAYTKRRDVVVKGLRELGWPIDPPKATLYVWLKTPPRFKTSKDWSTYLLDNTDVVVTPGSAFGEGGEGYFRLSLVSPVEVLETALQRLRDKGIRYE